MDYKKKKRIFPSSLNSFHFRDLVTVLMFLQFPCLQVDVMFNSIKHADWWIDHWSTSVCLTGAKERSPYRGKEKSLCGQEKSLRNPCSDWVWIKFIMGPWKCVCICLCVHYSIPKPTNIAVSFFFVGVGGLVGGIKLKRRCGCYRGRLSVCLSACRYVCLLSCPWVSVSVWHFHLCFVCVRMLSRCWFERCCLWLWNGGKKQNKRITQCVCAYLCACVCSGRLTAGPDVEVSPPVSFVFALFISF